eukprot:CAMPEP_0113687018 /NCGR_PEP_ID=MMETSP0038_2-20120614/15659_1 /TAXON_ID=2898 /ORGANISM="Cryptomonas paramecium" /LENGTH=533 /DNA_ID=CAMNT_0000607499 /DNA_START=105 /DNA_END=1703 /DNA_ORIENTATION=- /assembly_acc=CAM_ASM_000170
MKAIRGPLYRLNTSGYDLNLTTSPLGQSVDRSKISQKSRSQKLRPASRPSTSESGRLPLSKFARQSESGIALLSGNERLGDLIGDWKERGFELCHETCELRYHSSSSTLDRANESIHVPGMISLGFIQAHTRVCVGEVIETIDRNLETAERLRLFTIEVIFHSDESMYPRYYVLGHPDVNERDRWLHAMKFIVERKIELQDGWEQFCRNNQVGDAVKAVEWLRFRTGDIRPQINIAARRRARLQNGKVHKDVPLVFSKYSEECTAWPNLPVASDLEPEPGPYKRVMDVTNLVEALADLGLDLSPKVTKRLLEEVRKNPPNPDVPGKIDLRRFAFIFRSCVEEFMVSPSAEMKQSLMNIMQGSKNPFLSLLSPAEQMYLIEGQDSDGRYVCTCKMYSKDTVLVRQGDEGDSMFVIIEGNLSVVVTFGSGSATIQKEVAVLPAGSVMGEMSLVLGKPRSATCIVKSETASVAEIAKSAMIRLLDARPSLARELEEMVYRRDTANYLSAGRSAVTGLGSAAAMAAYRQRSNAKGAP